jgi:hypothetical protein
MERGLIWLPLLALFIWLTWSGWNEYQKVEAYRGWASKFDKSKYDIYAVLGQKGSDVTWGKPSRREPKDLETFSLKDINSIALLVDNSPVDLETPPDRGRNICLEFIFFDAAKSVKIPFTEIAIALDWAKYLQQELPRV